MLPANDINEIISKLIFLQFLIRAVFNCGVRIFLFVSRACFVKSFLKGSNDFIHNSLMNDLSIFIIDQFPSIEWKDNQILVTCTFCVYVHKNKRDQLLKYLLGKQTFISWQRLICEVGRTTVINNRN